MELGSQCFGCNRQTAFQSGWRFHLAKDHVANGHGFGVSDQTFLIGFVSKRLGHRILGGFYPQVRSLRDASLEQLDARRADLSDVVYRRCRFVIEENQRVLDIAAALALAKKLQDHLNASAGISVTIGLSGCLGMCDKGPIMVVNPGVVETHLFDHDSFSDFPDEVRKMMKPPHLLTGAILRGIRRRKYEVTFPRSLWAGVVGRAAVMAAPAVVCRNCRRVCVFMGLLTRIN